MRNVWMGRGVCLIKSMGDVAGAFIGCCCSWCEQYRCLFFNETATTEIYTLSYTFWARRVPWFVDRT